MAKNKIKTKTEFIFKTKISLVDRELGLWADDKGFRYTIRVMG